MACGGKSDEIRILLAGKCGGGTSSTGNTILGKDVFKTRASKSSNVTSECEIASASNRFGRNVVVVDTPGFVHPSLTDNEVTLQIGSFCSKQDEGFDAVLFVIDPNPTKDENKQAINAFFSGIGRKCSGYVIFVSTYWDTVPKKRESHLQLSGVFSTLYTAFFKTQEAGQFATFNNKAKEPEYSQQVQDLFKIIADRVSANKGKRLSNAIFRRISRKLEGSLGSDSYSSSIDVDEKLDSLDLRDDDPTPKRKGYSKGKPAKPPAQQSASELEERRILLVGRTGAGKSSTGNTILGQKLFDEGGTGTSVTRKSRCNSVERFGKKLVVVDTPGFYDTVLSTDQCIDELVRSCALLTPGIHGMVFVFSSAERFTKESRSTIELFFRVFGEEVAKNTLILVTKLDTHEPQLTAKQFLGTCGTQMQELRNRVGKREIAFFNREKDQVKSQQQVEDLLKMIEEMLNTNKHKYFRNDLFDKMEGMVTTYLKTSAHQNLKASAHRILDETVTKKKEPKGAASGGTGTERDQMRDEIQNADPKPKSSFWSNILAAFRKFFSRFF